VSYRSLLEEELQSHSETRSLLASGIVRVISVDQDMGPALKLLGLLSLRSQWHQHQHHYHHHRHHHLLLQVAKRVGGGGNDGESGDGNGGDDVSGSGGNSDVSSSFGEECEEEPDYWLIADDDVFYHPSTIVRYQRGIEYLASSSSSTSSSSSKSVLDSTVLTHFASDERVVVKIHGEASSSSRAIAHIQGVDTVLFSRLLLQQQYDERSTLHPDQFASLLLFFHAHCRESFYQDDYLISFAINTGGLYVHSLSKNSSSGSSRGSRRDNVAKHIEGVSKSNSQMHMKPHVFQREEATKACLVKHATHVLQHINLLQGDEL